MADSGTVVLIDVVNATEYRKKVVSEFYVRAAKLTLDGRTWDSALIRVGKDYGLFS